jgi:uncharacterized protein (DUF885 family)
MLRLVAVALLALALTTSASRAQVGEGGVADPALAALVDEWWGWRLQSDPLYASYVGVDAYRDRLADRSPAAREAHARAARAFRDRLDALDADALRGEDAITADILGRLLDDDLAAHRFGAHRLPLTATDGPHVALTRLPSQTTVEDADDAEAYLARLAAWPAYVDALVADLREGIEAGATLPAAALAGVPDAVEAHVVDDPETSVFWAPFDRLPDALPAAERERLRAAARRTIADALVPGYAALLAFLRDEYVPAARATVGASDLPDGEAYYRWRVRHFTTTDATPAEIHELGLAEVARIRAEMEAVVEETGFEGSFDAFLTFLRTDPRFTPASPEALLQEGAWIAMRMNAHLPRLFGRLPRLPYTVEPVPDHLAPTFTAGYYLEPPANGRVPGVYWLNTYDLPSRPTWALEALTFHEAVPGHHLQIALAQELDHLPAFRRALVLTAYEEGWGLYAERLGYEAGFYTDPHRRFGQLVYEMWRACRLVVDTGIHAFGWSRQRAVDYMTEHTALSALEIETEVDRYIGWPGQALGYKMGELTIRRLRADAEAALGDRFDVRAFHDEVLGHGELPMATLEAVVRGHVADRLAD